MMTLAKIGPIFSAFVGPEICFRVRQPRSRAHVAQSDTNHATPSFTMWRILTNASGYRLANKASL